MKYYIGVDLGGTTFSSILVNESYDILAKSNKLLVSNYQYGDDLIQAISLQIKEIIPPSLSIQDISGIGISAPGPLDSKMGRILDTPNLTILRNYPIVSRLSAQFPATIIALENDANLFALGESILNDSSNKIIVGITLGTGLGFGIVINGILFTGANGLAAEYGISPVAWGSWEEEISIRWMEKQSILLYNKRHSPKVLSELALSGNSDALNLWKEFGRKLGFVLSHVINMLDPHKIVIGGGLSSSFSLFESEMRNILNQYSPSYKINQISIYESKLKEISSQIGAIEFLIKSIGNSDKSY